MVAFVDDASRGDPDEEKKYLKQIKLFPLFLVQLAVGYWYLMPEEKCFFRRKRLSYAEKQMIIEAAKVLEEETRAREFISPKFVDPEKFIIKSEDVGVLKKKLFEQTMNREYKLKMLLISNPIKQDVICDSQEI